MGIYLKVSIENHNSSCDNWAAAAEWLLNAPLKLGAAGSSPGGARTCATKTTRQQKAAAPEGAARIQCAQDGNRREVVSVLLQQIQ